MQKPALYQHFSRHDLPPRRALSLVIALAVAPPLLADQCTIDVKEVAVSNAKKATSTAEKKQLLSAAAKEAAQTRPTITRQDELDNIAVDLAAALTAASMLSNKDTADKLSAGLTAGCQALQHNVGRENTKKAAFDAAGIDQTRAEAEAEAEAETKAKAEVEAKTKFKMAELTGGNSSYTLFLGSVNSLEANGGWKSNLEAAFVSRTPWCLRGENPCLYNTEPKHYGVFDLSYVKIGAIDDSKKNTDSGSTTSKNPFTDQSGVLRTNAAYEIFNKTNLVGATAGAGFTSRSDTTANAHTKVSERFFGGLLFLADYGATSNKERATGRVLIGYANDRAWVWDDQVTTDGTTTTVHRSARDRWIVDARIDTPALDASGHVKLSVRLYADSPLHHEGPADVRISLLATVALDHLFGS